MLIRHRSRFGVAAGMRRQRGVGLIEVLIAVLVLSIGMLGVAGLQAWSLRNNMSSLQRGMAVVHAYYIADIMRADRITAVNGGFDLAIGAATPTPTDFASTSLADWRGSMQESLGPTATGSVDCNGAICDVVVRWDDSRAEGGIDQQEIQIEVEL
jgi:type IV pilus assembly protein PilV